MAPEAARVLVVDDDEDVLLAARLLLKQEGYSVRTESDPHQIPRLLGDDPPDMVLLDMNYTQDAASGREGFYWLERIRQLDPAAVVVRSRRGAGRWRRRPGDIDLLADHCNDHRPLRRRLVSSEWRSFVLDQVYCTRSTGQELG